MNRRVLLIDADLAFRDTLTAELARYQVVVMTEPDSERALALANADAPALIVLCIEEADKKAGFRVFEKCKKGALSKVPLILVTSTVPPESFAKHRGLKNHADEYIDKRTMTSHELVGKIDGLISLGDPVAIADEELSIPIEDEIPMEIGDGDVVLDEVVGDDPADEFQTDDAQTAGPNDGISMESVVEAETDAAFAALLGDEDPAPRAQPAPEPVHLAEPAPDPVPELIQDGRGRGTTPPPFQADSVPGIIHDGGIDHDLRAASPPAVEEHVRPAEAAFQPPVEELPAEEPIEHAIQPIELAAEHPVEQVEHEVHTPSQRFESSPAFPIDDDELLAIDDELPVEVEDDVQSAAPEHEAPLAALVEAAHAPAPQVAEEPRARAKFIESSTVVESLAAEAAPARRGSPTQQPIRGGSGSHPAIDLGLDMVAQDAESEQSGIYDRRALRKIGELERQIAQLKTELDRARAAAEAATKGAGRENQFLNLRESMLGKEKELKEAKALLVTRDQEVAEAREKMRQAEHARTALQAKNTELETRLFDDSGKSTQLAAAAKASATQLAQLQHELDAITKSHAAAEAGRASLERDLANERATGKASASEAERMLRVEREQLIQRHQSELAAARHEGNSAQEQALAELREELVGAHAGAIDQAIEELRRANASEHTQIVNKLEATHAGEMVSLKADHAGELGRIRNELGVDVERAKAAHAAAEAAHADALAAAEAGHREALAAASAAHEHALASVAANQGGALDELAAKHAAELAARDASHAQLRDRDAATHAAAIAGVEAQRKADAAAHADAVAAVEAQHANAVAAVEAQREADAAAHAEMLAAAEAQRVTDASTHAGAISALEAQRRGDAIAHADAMVAAEAQRTADAAVHAEAIEKLKADLERAAAGTEVKVLTAKRELDQAIAQHEQARGELHEQHQAALAIAAAAHQQELAKLQADREQLTDATKRTADAHRAALAEAQTKFDAEVAQVHDAAGREIAEHKAAVLAAKRAADESIAQIQKDREAADQSHAQSLAELSAKHERALAMANGDFLKQKSVADAEHGKALATQQAEADKARTELEAAHARTAKEIGAERDELKRGLSSARDSLKRSEGELASAVQSIADRNAELRSHASAIAERDQRIAELRKEIESLE